VPRIAIAFLSVLFLVPQGLLANAQLVTVVMTKTQPSQSCPLVPTPPAATSFSAADGTVYLWFYITGLTGTDSIAADFYLSGSE
jgi:hypothetical protein